MNITVTGASGFIGRRLLERLCAQGHTPHALSRHIPANLPAGARASVWDVLTGPPPEAALRDAEAVIHLAGEPVAQRWTAVAKRRIRDSRVLGTRRLVEALGGLSKRPQVLVCASAVGYYGSRGDEMLTEASPAGAGFLAEVCAAWEAEAAAAEKLGMRVVSVRTGMVLERQGGALARMLPAFRLGVGGRLGAGRQWTPWIHLDDLCEMFRFAVDQPVRGVLNGAAPTPVTNLEFTRALAGALHRPSIFAVPGLALRVLFGEMSEILLASQRVLPQAATAAGFRFEYPRLEAALADALR